MAKFIIGETTEIPPDGDLRKLSVPLLADVYIGHMVRLVTKPPEGELARAYWLADYDRLLRVIKPMDVDEDTWVNVVEERSLRCSNAHRAVLARTLRWLSEQLDRLHATG